jgi:hypothetical protein
VYNAISKEGGTVNTNPGFLNVRVLTEVLAGYLSRCLILTYDLSEYLALSFGHTKGAR